MPDLRRLKFVRLLDNGQSHFGSSFLLGRGKHAAVLSSFTYIPSTQPSPVARRPSDFHHPPVLEARYLDVPGPDLASNGRTSEADG